MATMRTIRKVTIYRGGDVRNVNAADASQWLAAGWSLDQPAVEPPAETSTLTDPAPRKRRASKTTEPIIEPIPTPEVDPSFRLDGL